MQTIRGALQDHVQQTNELYQRIVEALVADGMLDTAGCLALRNIAEELYADLSEGDALAEAVRDEVLQRLSIVQEAEVRDIAARSIGASFAGRLSPAQWLSWRSDFLQELRARGVDTDLFDVGAMLDQVLAESAALRTPWWSRLGGG